mmetsp:Transcript_96307/g.272282  ORF Transcript_96307/g.272282 Transcript_96307/m.272282 type:complete len:275 (+) Transcript_96307:197-1021(+)
MASSLARSIRSWSCEALSSQASKERGCDGGVDRESVDGEGAIVDVVADVQSGGTDFPGRTTSFSRTAPTAPSSVRVGFVADCGDSATARATTCCSSSTTRACKYRVVCESSLVRSSNSRIVASLQRSSSLMLRHSLSCRSLSSATRQLSSLKLSSNLAICASLRRMASCQSLCSSSCLCSKSASLCAAMSPSTGGAKVDGARTPLLVAPPSLLAETTDDLASAMVSSSGGRELLGGATSGGTIIGLRSRLEQAAMGAAEFQRRCASYASCKSGI